MNGTNINYDSVENQQLRSDRLKSDLENRSIEVDATIPPQQSLFLEQIRNESVQHVLNPIGATIGQSYLANTVRQTTDDRLSFSQFVTNPSDVYERLNSGEYYPLYENIIAGGGDEERLARDQTTSQVWGRGWTRFLGQVGTSAVGGIVGLPVGLAEWINTGNFEATYDNSFTKMLDDFDRKTQLRNNIYYTQNEKDASLFGQVATHRFWADKFLGGAAFTVGMMLGEGVLALGTGGLSLGRIPFTVGSSLAKLSARLGVKGTGSMLGRGLNSANTALANAASGVNVVGSQALRTATAGRRTGQWVTQTANDIRFLATSSGYEAGLEARMYRKDAEDQFYDYYRQHGITPTEEQKANFYEELDNTSNFVFGANMGLLGVSNSVLFGRMFGVGNYFKGVTRPVGDAINRRVFGIGTKQVAPGQFQVIKRNTFQKILTPTWYGLARPALTEGFWEEGGQSVASNMMSEYIESTYNVDLTRNTLSYLEAFQNAMETTFGEREGQTEVLIGSLIGVLFGGTIGGGFSTGRRAMREQERRASTLTELSQAPENIVNALYTQTNVLSQIGNSNRMQALDEGIEEAEGRGDLVEANLKTKSLIVSALQAANSVGKTNSFLEVLKGTIRGIEDSKIEEQFGITSQEEIETFKQDKIDAITRISETYAKATRTAETFIPDNSLQGEFKGSEPVLRDSLAFAITMGTEAEQTGIDAIKTIKDIFNELQDSANVTATDVFGMLSLTPQELRTEFENTQKNITDLETEIQELTEELKQYQHARPGEAIEDISRAEVKLRQTQEKLHSQVSVLEGLFETIENQYFDKLQQEGTVSIDVLSNLVDSLEGTRKTIESLEFTNPEEFARLATAYDALEKALTLSSGFTTIYEGLLNPKTRLRTARGFLGNKIKKPLNEEVLETLTNILTVAPMISAIVSEEANIQVTPLEAQGEPINPEEEGQELSPEMEQRIQEIETERQREINYKPEDSQIIDEIQNSFYIEAVQTGELTVEQAKALLIKAGQEGSFEYNQLNAGLIESEAQRNEVLNLQELRKIVGNLDLIKKHFPSNITTDTDGLIEPITQEDLDSFVEIQDKITNEATDLTAKEIEEYEALRQRFLGLNILQGTNYRGYTLLELLKLYSQIEKEINNEIQNKKEYTEEEYAEIAIESENIPLSRQPGVDPSITNTIEYAFTRITRGGVYLSHLHLSDLITRLQTLHPTAEVKVNGKSIKSIEDVEKFNGKGNTKVNINIDSETYSMHIRGKAGQDSGHPVLLKTTQPATDLNNLFGLQAVKVAGQKGQWYVVYENGRPVRSSFKYENESGLVFDPIIARQIKPGNEVTLVYDETDSYNKTLPDNERIERANIYVVKDGKIIGKLKSTKDDKLYEVRKKAVEEGQVGIKVRTPLPSIPLLNLNPDGTKNLVAVQKKDIISRGWVQDGQFNSELEKDISTRYVEVASQLHPTRKIAFVVVRDKVSGMKVALPVEVNTEANQEAIRVFEDLTTNPDISDIEKAISLNEILIENGMGLSGYRFDESNLNDFSYAQEVLEALRQTQQEVDFDRFVNKGNYKIYSIVDVSTDPFTPPKYILDFDSVRSLSKKAETSKKQTTPKTKPKPNSSTKSTAQGKMNKKCSRKKS